MQILAVGSLVALIAVVYGDTTRRATVMALDLMTKTGAKYGPFEIQLEKRMNDFSKQMEHAPDWAQLTASKLDSGHIGLVLFLNKHGEYKLPSSSRLRDRMRELRECGLISHDAQSLKEASYVRLTEFGADFAKEISVNYNSIPTTRGAVKDDGNHVVLR